jgi:hypothetical protein
MFSVSHYEANSPRGKESLHAAINANDIAYDPHAKVIK